MKRKSSLQLKQKKFSLIELLIVLALLAVLISLISPNYQNLISKSHQLDCKNKLRHYQISHTLYSYDHGGLVVPIWRTVPPGTPGNWHKNFWIGNSTYLSYMGIEGTTIIPDEYKCPATANQWKHSYGINRDPLNWPSLKDTSLDLTKVSFPSKKIFLSEGTDFHLSRVFADYANRWDIYFEDRLWSVAYRHQEGANISFLDGHLEYRSKYDIYFPNEAQKRKDMWELDRDAFIFSN